VVLTAELSCSLKACIYHKLVLLIFTGAVILLGKTNMFRYNNPAEAAQMKEELKKVSRKLSRHKHSQNLH